MSGVSDKNLQKSPQEAVSQSVPLSKFLYAGQDNFW